MRGRGSGFLDEGHIVNELCQTRRRSRPISLFVAVRPSIFAVQFFSMSHSAQHLYNRQNRQNTQQRKAESGETIASSNIEFKQPAMPLISIRGVRILN